MAVRMQPTDVRSRPAIAVEDQAPPRADLVFLSTDRRGSPGNLNDYVLADLGLPPERPGVDELAKGYAIRPTPHGVLCYVVTIDEGLPVAEALSANMRRALADPGLPRAGSWWVPLMGTGFGRLSHADSFDVIFKALAAASPIRERRATATISLPKGVNTVERGKMILRAQAASRQIAEEAEVGVMPAEEDPYLLPRSEAVTAALVFATALADLPGDRRKSLSTTLLFFALAESQSDAAPVRLREDPAAKRFAGTVRRMAQERYGPAWSAYFKSEARPREPGEGTLRLLRPTKNIAAILQRAHSLADGEITIDPLIRALLGHGDGRVRTALERMGLEPGQLRAAYEAQADAPTPEDGPREGEAAAEAPDEPGRRGWPAPEPADSEALESAPEPVEAAAPTQTTDEPGEVAREETTQFVPDNPEAETDELNRSVLAIGLARRLHQIWCKMNVRGQQAGAGNASDTAAFVVHLDAPWGGGKTTFANFVSRVLNPHRGGDAPAHFLLKRYPGKDLGGVFLHEPPADKAEADALLKLAEAERRPWVIVEFNAWQYEHCAPPWWVFYQAIRHQCFAAIRREGNHPWCAAPPTGRRAAIGRYRAYARLVLAEYAWRLTNPKILTLLATAVLSGSILLLLWTLGVFGITEQAGRQTAGFVLANGVGLLLAGLTGISAVWGIGALVTESIVPGTDTLAERLSLGRSDPFARFRKHFDATMRAVRRPVLVVIDDLDRCQPAFVVDLVRGIQTILRSSRVTFLILGDRDWIERAFESHHHSMSAVDVGPEQTFGARFVEKAIQMSFVLPSLGRQSKEDYVKRVLLAGREPAAVAPDRLDDETTSRIREFTNRESTDAAGAPLESAAIAAKAIDEILNKSPETVEQPQRAQVEQIVGETLAISATVDQRVHDAVVHELGVLAGAFPANPRQIKRIVNAITIYWAVALQRPGLKADAELRFQLAIWVILMTEWPQTWRTLIACPEMVDCICAADPLATLARLEPDKLPGSLASSEAELERILADQQLVKLVKGEGATPHAPLSSKIIPQLAELTPLRTRQGRLKGLRPESRPSVMAGES